MQSSQKFIILGSGGHATVITDLLESLSYKIKGVFVKGNNLDKFLAYPILGDDSLLKDRKFRKYNYAIGVGMVNDSLKTRNRLYNNIKDLKLSIPTLIHKSAVISSRVNISEGCQVLLGVKIGVNVNIGSNCIINTNASIDHGANIGANCHIGPGVTICGNVNIGENTFIGAGTTVINDIVITKDCLVGAGSLILKNISKSGVYFGRPAQKK